MNSQNKLLPSLSYADVRFVKYAKKLDSLGLNVFFLRVFERLANGEKNVIPYNYIDYRNERVPLTQKLQNLNLFNNKTIISGLGLITGKTSGITIFDIDSAELYEEIKAKLNLTDKTIAALVIKTYKGYQLYYSYMSTFKSASLMPSIKADILNDNKQTFALPCNPFYTFIKSMNRYDNFFTALQHLEPMPPILWDYLKNIETLKNITPTVPTINESKDESITNNLINFKWHETKLITINEEPIGIWIDKILEFWKTEGYSETLPNELMNKLQNFFTNEVFPLNEWGKWHDIHKRHNYAVYVWVKLNSYETSNSIAPNKRVEFFKLFAAIFLKYNLASQTDIKKVDNIIKANYKNIKEYEEGWEDTSLYMQELKQIKEQSILTYLEPNKDDETLVDRFVIFLDPISDKFNLVDMKEPIGMANPIKFLKGSLKNILHSKELKPIEASKVMVAYPLSNPNRSEVLYYDGVKKLWYFNELIEPIASKKVKNYTQKILKGEMSKATTPPAAISALVKNLANHNKEVEYYLFNYIATLLKKPQHGHTAIVLKGVGGVGKSIFTWLLNEIFTQQYCSFVGFDTFISQFNGYALNKLFLFIDETTENRNNKEAKKFMEQIKRYIANENLSIEKKGKEPFTAPNYLNIIITTNAREPVLSYGAINRRDNEFTTSSVDLKDIEPFKTALLNNISPLDLLRDELDELYKYLASLPFDEALFRKQIITPEALAMAETTRISYDDIAKALIKGDSEVYAQYMNKTINIIEAIETLSQRKHAFITTAEITEFFAYPTNKEIKKSLILHVGAPKKKTLKYFDLKTKDIFIFNEVLFNQIAFMTPKVEKFTFATDPTT